MLSHVYEIEGLMLVTRRLGEENTPEVITNKIQRKVRELAQMCGVELIAAPESAAKPEPEEPVKTPEAPAPEMTAETTQEHLPEEDYDADETWQHDNGEEFKEVFKLDYEEPKHEQEKPAVQETPAPEAAVVQPPVFRGPTDTSDEPVPEPDPEVLPEDDRDLPDITVEFIEVEDDAVPEPQEEMPIPPVPTEFPDAPVEMPAAPMRVDEKLQRHLSQDIRKAISLNDRFRFQRELFAGSSSAMDTAIEHIEMMNSYGNAELYFFSQLHWDRDNEVVKDFMAIVRNHFQH